MPNISMSLPVDLPPSHSKVDEGEMAQFEDSLKKCAPFLDMLMMMLVCHNQGYEP